ncbi:MAG: recombinase family protein [Syntrophobacteraceae bacterium]
MRQNGYSCNRIAGALNAQGIRSKTVSRCDQSTIMRIVNR